MMKIGTRVMRGVDWKWGDQVPKTVLLRVFYLIDGSEAVRDGVIFDRIVYR